MESCSETLVRNQVFDGMPCVHFHMDKENVFSRKNVPEIKNTRICLII